MDVYISRRRFAAYILAAIFGTATLMGLGGYIALKASQPAVVVTAPAPVQTAPTGGTLAHADPIPSSPKTVSGSSTDSAAIELMPGTGDGPYDDPAAYRCKTAYTAIQLPIGKTVQADGASYTLTDKNPNRGIYDDQKSVHVSIKLGKGVSAPTMIVNTGAHRISPEVYGQGTLQLGLKAGGTGEYTLLTSGYVDNYLDSGIIDVTICTIKTSK